MLRKSFNFEHHYFGEWKPATEFGPRNLGQVECVICHQTVVRVQHDQVTCGRMGCQIKRNRQMQHLAKQKKKEKEMRRKQQSGADVPME